MGAKLEGGRVARSTSLSSRTLVGGSPIHALAPEARRGEWASPLDRTSLVCGARRQREWEIGQASRQQRLSTLTRPTSWERVTSRCIHNARDIQRQAAKSAKHGQVSPKGRTTAQCAPSLAKLGLGNTTPRDNQRGQCTSAPRIRGRRARTMHSADQERWTLHYTPTTSTSRERRFVLSTY